MKVLIAVVSLLAVASAQQQLLNPYFNEGLVQYNDWQPLPAPLGPNGLYNPYAVQQLLPAQQFPLVPQFQPQLPPVAVPFPAQFPLPAQYPVPLPVQLPQQLPQLAVPAPFSNLQLPPQTQLVRHGLPHSDAAAVSYSSLHYTPNNNAQPLAAVVPVGTPVAAPVATGGVNGAAGPVVPAVGPSSLAAGKVSVVKDIATFGTEYGTGADKSPVARYEAINAGSVHVAPLPGHTVDQKLIAPGTGEQKL
uniref:Uncharacterized protein n=1 Tax=Anopheles dirus TaxID=7168 RepID=A0A182MZ30_9DIPT